MGTKRQVIGSEKLDFFHSGACFTPAIAYRMSFCFPAKQIIPCPKKMPEIFLNKAGFLTTCTRAVCVNAYSLEAIPDYFFKRDCKDNF